LSLIHIPQSFSDELEFQNDTETALEESTETIDGKEVRRVRSGKVRQRKGDAKVGAIEESETKKYQRRHEALSLTSFGIGPFGSSNVGESELLYGGTIGKNWEVSDIFEIRADFMGVANGKGSFWSLGFGPSWIPMTGEISPIIGVELGLGYGNGNNNNAGGFYGQGNFGLRLFRLSNIQMEILGTYAQTITKEVLSVYGAQLRLLF